MFAGLADDPRFTHVLALLLVATWLLVVGSRVLANERLSLLMGGALPLAATPYASPGLAMALLSTGLLIACASLERLSHSAALRARGRAVTIGCALLSGILLLLGGVGLMVLTRDGPRAWSWWIGLGTAGFGALVACERVLAARLRLRTGAIGG